MDKTKVCGVDVSVGDVFEDHSGNPCIVYDLFSLSKGSELIINFYWIDMYGNLYDDYVSETRFASVFKKKLGI